MSQIQNWPKDKKNLKAKIPKKTKGTNKQWQKNKIPKNRIKKEKITILNQEVMQRPERRRRKGRSSARFAFAWRSSLFCVPVLFLYLCLLWVYVFFGFYVGPAKLQRGATPPSVMVLFHIKDALTTIPPGEADKKGKMHWKWPVSSGF